MYPLHQSPIPTTSGFAPHRPSSAFKHIHPAAPLTAPRPETQGSPSMNSSTKETGSIPESPVPCAQASPVSIQGMSPQSNNVQVPQTQRQNIA